VSRNFSHRCNFSLSTRFSSKFRGNCPCIFFSRHLSSVFSVMLSFTCLVHLLRRLAVCNTAELMLCWRALTVCICGSSLLSTHSTGNANDPVAWILFFVLNSVLKSNLSLPKYSFFNFSFSFLCSTSWLSFMPNYLYAFLGSSFWMSFSNVLSIYVLLRTLTF